jgi:hypothetical protein
MDTAATAGKLTCVLFGATEVVLVIRRLALELMALVEDRGHRCLLALLLRYVRDLRGLRRRLWVAQSKPAETPEGEDRDAGGDFCSQL